MGFRRHVVLLGILGLAASVWGQATRPAESAGKKPTLAVLPFVAVSGDAKEKGLAEKMRFAVSQKLSTDQNAVDRAGPYDRMDNVQVDGVISAVQVPWGAAGKTPDENDVQQVIGALGTDYTILGSVAGRKLSLTLYKGAVAAKQASVEIPPGTESPKLAVEKVLTELTGTAFAHIREVEADHSNATVEARFAARPNLVADPGFELAAKETRRVAAQWQAILGPEHYAPPLISAEEARGLKPDRVAVVPREAAGVKDDKAGGHVLMMRMGKGVAESNGLACETTWIPVVQGKKYRFTAQYHSTGPVARLFLKGFAYKPDQYGSKEDPEAVRREYYRAQVLSREKNAGWDLIEMDFTPGSLKPTDPKIEWVKVDLWVYLKPGDIFFDEVVVKCLAE